VSLNQLLSSIGNIIPLNKSEREELSQRVIERKIKRKQFILQESDICKHYTFVAEGYCRKYKVDDKGAEHNLQFVAENDWITEINSFYFETPSRVFIEAMEPAVILQISKPDLLHLYSNSPKFNRIFRVIIENRFAELEERVLHNISSTADERYLAFIRKYPQLSSRIPNTQIASYLGITPEFLSKIRKNLSQKP
jgi:CRP-like cAMP-binding protein